MNSGEAERCGNARAALEGATSASDLDKANRFGQGAATGLDVRARGDASRRGGGEAGERIRCVGVGVEREGG